MKLAVIVNKQFLVIPDSALANIRQQAPLFNYDSTPGKLLFPISISYPENCKQLGLPSESYIVDEPVRMPCQMLVLHTWLLDGELIITKSNGKTIEISIACPYYDISEELFKTNIRDLDWDNVELADPVPQIYIDMEFNLIGGAGADTITVFTSYGEYEYVTDGFEITPAIIGALIADINDDTDESGISATIIGSNVLRLRQHALGTLNRVFNTSDVFVTSATYTITYDFMTWLTDWHDSLAAYLETTMEASSLYDTTPIQWPTMFNSEHYGDLNPDFTGWINNYEQGKPWINYSSSESFDGNRFTLIPQFYLLYVFDKIFSLAKISLAGKGYTEERFRRILVDNNHSIGKEWYDPIGDTEYVSFSAIIEPANHLPDMTVGEFINAYRAKFNFYFYYRPDTRTVEIKWREDVITAHKRFDYNQKLFAPNPMDEFELYNGIRFTSPIDTNDKKANIYPAFHDTSRLQQEDYLIGAGKLVINSAFSHPSMQIIDGDTRPESGATVKVPVKSAAGSGDEWEVRRNSFTPQLLIYVGQPGVYDANFATTDQLDVDGNGLDLDISLQWDEVYIIFWLRWLTFITNSAPRRVIMALGISDIMNLPLDEFMGHNNTDWLVEQYEISDIVGDVVLVEFILRRRKNFFT